MPREHDAFPWVCDAEVGSGGWAKQGMGWRGGVGGVPRYARVRRGSCGLGLVCGGVHAVVV